MPPHLGRLFLEEDARTGAERVVLLSHGAWTNRFASNPAIVGTTIDFGGNSHLVVGVVAEGFHFPTPDTEFWMPYIIAPTTAENAPGQSGGVAFATVVVFRALGRLRPGVSAEQAATEAGSILQGSSDAFPALAGGSGQRGVRVVPLLEEMVGEYRPALSILTAVTVLVLLVACLNAAGLLLARGVARQRMLAIRAALGASRSRLVRQLLTESTVLSLGGGVLGLAAAAVFLRAVPALAPSDVARLEQVRIDGVVFAFTAGLSILVGLLCGAGSAFQRSQLHLVRTLNDGSAQSAGGSGARCARRRDVRRRCPGRCTVGRAARRGSRAPACGRWQGSIPVSDALWAQRLTPSPAPGRHVAPAGAGPRAPGVMVSFCDVDSAAAPREVLEAHIPGLAGIHPGIRRSADPTTDRSQCQ